MAIAEVLPSRRRSIGEATVLRLLPHHRHRMVGPFIFVDLFGFDDGPHGPMQVDAHPHIGLATVTYLLEGAALHRDSTGAVQRIDPGAVNWMIAGAGVCHTERAPDGFAGPVRGVQIWVALPGTQEEGPARFLHAPAEHLPTWTDGEATVRLLGGTIEDRTAPSPLDTELLYAEVLLGRGASFEVPDTVPERAVISLGSGLIVDGTPLEPCTVAVLDPGPATLTTSDTAAGDGPVRALVIGGEPVGPRLIWWNFVASRQELIDRAKQRWTDQEFPEVPGDHEVWVPLPSS